jgi:hypothetical protein
MHRSPNVHTVAALIANIGSNSAGFFRVARDTTGTLEMLREVLELRAGAH